MNEGFISSAKVIFRKSHLPFRVIGQVRTWPTYFADYFGLVDNSHIKYQLRNGVKCLLRPQTTDRKIFNDIWLRKVYCTEQDIRRGEVVVDIGAHIGLFSLFAASRGARVISFEPLQENYHLLKQNVELNELQGRIDPFNMAVWSDRGTVNLYCARGNTGGHSVLIPSNDSRTIEATTLADVFEAHNIERCRVLKIDAEGAEYPILYTAPFGVISRIDQISLEWHDFHNESRPDYDHNYLKAFLEKQGFRVFAKPNLEILVAIRNRE